MSKDITLVIPAKNESESLPLVLTELKKFNFKIIVIVERKDKKTVDSIKRFKKKLIFQKKRGYGDALKLGIKNVNTKYFCIFNADGSFNPTEISKFLKILKNKKKDIIFASRYEGSGKSDDDTIITFLGNKIFSYIGNLFFGLPISDILYTYVLASTRKLKKIRISSNDFRFCVELPIKSHRLGLKIISIESHERARFAGKKKVNELIDGTKILSELIKQFFKKKY